MKRAGFFLVVAGIVAIATVGCSGDPREGYSLSRPYDESITSVNVPVFDNTTYSTGLEAPLTEAIVKQLQQRTHWRVVSASEADATLTGVITQSDLRTLGDDRLTGLVQEMAVTLSLDIELRDNRTGKTLMSRKGVRVTDTFVPQRLTGERIEVGQMGAVDGLAKRVVDEIRSEW